MCVEREKGATKMQRRCVSAAPPLQSGGTLDIIVASCDTPQRDRLENDDRIDVIYRYNP